ncbi:Uu.00g016120.m01.CDS01 [Anthostomella pinea]|uniref:Uu.00g016120.m01.CDS01 n=1 Tax=Anthostomella pinea TaxID=933095 RepID=A0AAI8VYM8_9PEZI|nr:Uu.00g016120.m01.CDS01 [Anthostomella pinea]
MGRSSKALRAKKRIIAAGEDNSAGPSAALLAPGRQPHTLAGANLSEFKYEFPGFYFGPGQSSLLVLSKSAELYPSPLRTQTQTIGTNQDLFDNSKNEELRGLLATMGVRFMYQATPHLLSLLSAIFRFASQQREHYDVNNETDAMKNAFYARVVAAGSADTGPQSKVPPNMGQLEAVSVRKLTDLYVDKRKSFQKRQMRKGTSEQDEGKGNDRNDDENDDEDEVQIEDNNKDKAAGDKYTKKQTVLLKYIDQWIDWVEVQKDLLRFLDAHEKA